MSFNIRYRTAPDGAHAWSRRKTQVVERIQSFSPDLLGLQECRDDSQAAFLRRSLPAYTLLGTPRGAPGSADLEMAPLLFRKDSFELLDGGTLWLSQTPEIPGSLSWGAAPAWSRQVWLGGSLPRTLTWARLRWLAQPKTEIAFLNTHLDHASHLARWRGASLLRRFARRAFPGIPLILTGDFNVGRSSPVHRRLLAGSQKQPVWQDAHQAAPGAAEIPGSFHDFGRLQPALDIDWILASQHFTILEAGVDRAAGNASDHYPVWAVLRKG